MVKKTGALLILLTIANSIVMHGGESITIQISNSSWKDILVGSDCKTNPEEFISLKRNGTIRFPITLKEYGSNTACKIYGVEAADVNNLRQAVLCLLPDGCEHPNCQEACVCLDPQGKDPKSSECKRRSCPALDCKDPGSCANLGFKFVRGPIPCGGFIQRGQNIELHYGIVNTSENVPKN